MKNKWWDYYEVKEEGVFKISPSQFSKFIVTPWQWYREQILGEDKFEGNTSSYLGTIVHYLCECAIRDKPVCRDDIEEFLATIDDPEVDKEEIRRQYPLMAKVIVNEYVLKYKFLYKHTELYIGHKLTDSLKVEGSIDAILEDQLADGVKIVDYKTYNSKAKPKSMPNYYKHQLLVYAYILKQNGYNPTSIELVFVNRNIDGGVSEKTGKPLKSYPPEVTVLTEPVAEEDLAFIEGQLNLCKDTLDASNKYTSLRHVIWHDPRLE